MLDHPRRIIESQKAEETGNELNRAVKAALNAELRLESLVSISLSAPGLKLVSF